MDILHHGPHDRQATGFRGEGINLVSSLPNSAEKAFNRIGRANGAMHDWWESIQCQQMFFIFTQATDGFGIALLIFALKGRHIEQRILFLFQFEDASQFRADLFALAMGNGIDTVRCVCTTQRWRAVAVKRAETAASRPSCPSVTMRSTWVAPRRRTSCKRHLHPSLSSSAHARNASTSLFPSRPTPRAVTMMVESVCSPCRIVKWTPSRETMR